MIFFKTGRLTKAKIQFVISREELKSVGQYIYLGVTFSKNTKGRVTVLYYKWPTFTVKIDCKEIPPKYYQMIPKSL